MSGRTIRLRDQQDAEQDVVLSADRLSVAGVDFIVEAALDGRIRLRRAGTDGPPSPAVTAYVASAGDTQWVFLNGRVFRFEGTSASRRRRTARSGESLVAPMPATVRRVEARPGQAIRRGDILIVLEAMKMELPVRAPADGTIARVNCREGELVQAGQELVEVSS